MILQMDIEREEYDLIFDTANATFKKFTITVIEFYKLDILLYKYGCQIINTAFNKLLKNFRSIHIHPKIILRLSNIGVMSFLHSWNLPSQEEIE